MARILLLFAAMMCIAVTSTQSPATPTTTTASSAPPPLVTTAPPPSVPPPSPHKGHKKMLAHMLHYGIISLVVLCNLVLLWLVDKWDRPVAVEPERSISGTIL